MIFKIYSLVGSLLILRMAAKNGVVNDQTKTSKRLLLTSTSDLKREAIKEIPEFAGHTIITIDCKGAHLPNQPFGTESTIECAKERIRYAMIRLHNKEFDYVVAIENGIADDFEDRAFIVLMHAGKTVVGHSFGVPVPVSVRGRLTNQNLEKVVFNEKCQGYSKTAGEFISEDNQSIDHKNWYTLFGMNRVDQIIGAITNTINLL